MVFRMIEVVMIEAVAERTSGDEEIGSAQLARIMCGHSIGTVGGARHRSQKAQVKMALQEILLGDLVIGNAQLVKMYSSHATGSAANVEHRNRKIFRMKMTWQKRKVRQLLTLST